MTDYRLELGAWEDARAYAVLADLDPFDVTEAALSSGVQPTALGMFCEWRAMLALPGAVSVIAFDRATWEAFAILGILPAGAAGVAQVALVARHHPTWRRPLARLAALLRCELAGFAAERALTRIECRCWRDHPSAVRLLEAIGFRLEAELAGYARGAACFLQFVWTPQARS